MYLLDTYALGQPSTVGVYVVKGPKPTLVDCGYAASYQTVLSGLKEIGIAPSDVRYLIPTHVHLDHGGATGHLLKEMPNAEVIAQELGVQHLIDPTRLIASATKVFGSLIMQLYGSPEPVPAERITAVGEEMALDLGDGMSATLLHSPGHAPHQLSILIEREKALLTADAVGIVYPGLKTLIPTTPPPAFEPNLLVSTVRSLEQTDPGKLLVPHFGTRNDALDVFEDTKRKVTRWVKDTSEMRNRGMDLDAITDKMVEEVTAEAVVEDLPIYAKVSIRTSVMGILHYLEKNS